MSISKNAICALCGEPSTNSRNILVGSHGYVCFSCLGEIFDVVAKSYGNDRNPDSAKLVPNASNQCFLCSRMITKDHLVACRPPYYFCGECLGMAFSNCIAKGKEPIAIVNF